MQHFLARCIFGVRTQLQKFRLFDLRKGHHKSKVFCDLRFINTINLESQPLGWPLILRDQSIRFAKALPRSR